MKIVTALRIPAILLPLFLGLAGCADTPATPPPAAEEIEVPAYRIGVDDQLQVNVWRNPELSVNVPVRQDGMISVPRIGDVTAGGRTPEDLAGEIEKRIGKYVLDPNVTVLVTQMRSHEFLSRVRIAGAVYEPVSLPYRRGMTVLDLFLAAGGATEFASLNRTKLFRRAMPTASSGEPADEGEGEKADKPESGAQTMRVRLEDIIEDGDLSTNYSLRPGDIVTVPQQVF